MPKRDAKYMRDQREAIARAALDVLLEKGLYATSLRDICKAAGVSTGAFYNHFKTKDGLVLAAFNIDRLNYPPEPLPSNWEEYVDQVCGALITLRDKASFLKKRIRLNFQFAAELSQMERSPEGLADMFLEHSRFYERILLHLNEKNIIDLPLGLEKTIGVHSQMVSGAYYQAVSFPDLDVKYAAATLREGLAMTAGYQPRPSRPSKRPS